jgi:hypothetical protein
MKNLPLVPTVIINNAFTVDEINQLKNMISNHPESKNQDYIHDWEGPNYGKKLSTRCFFDFNKLETVSDLIKSKLPMVIKENIIPVHSFLLTSYVPYEIHCDSKWIDYAEDEVPYYLILISLTGNGSKTIILNQEGHYLHFVDYKKEHDKVPASEQITEEEFQRDFSHCWSQEREYVSVKDTFIWDVGSIIAFDIRYFHLSNNFTALGIDQKQCITLMTKIKQKDFERSYNN